MPKVSVIVPVYGVEPYLRQCLDSILRQTLENIEIIIVDDGSPDDCPSIIDEYAEQDSRIIAIHKQNAGVSAARNDGIKLASGDYVFFCDSDDWLPVDALKALLEAAEHASADVAIGDYIESSGSSERELRMFSNEFETESRISIDCIQKAVFNKGRANYSCGDFKYARGLGAPWHHLIRRELVADHGLEFNCRVRGIFDDGIFMLEVFEHAGCVVYIQEPTYYYRVVGTSITHGYKADLLDRYQRVYMELESFIDRNKKDEAFRCAYYVRVYAYLNKAMSAYFLNPANEMTEKERYAEYVRTVKGAPYDVAIREMDESALGYRRSRALSHLLKLHRYKAYWLVKKLFSG
ncbi:glycosyltransferase [Adlercreutzia sp. ZJ473]|uniref:glycosyltransferase family 2 protein n=1 Tax=Adlercreutzia sp. ZJ473 TaxID=2722822 RepID=UPI0015548D37|nr:glycosyltransferase [Adlercreutzia sp. ZJ473]